MERIGLALFLLLSLVLHTAGALLFEPKPEESASEQGSGETALEIGNLFDSVGQTAVSATTISAVSDSPKTTQRAPYRKLQTTAALQRTAPEVEPVAEPLPEAFTANAALSTPDIDMPKPVTARKAMIAAPVKQAVRIEEIEPQAQEAVTNEAVSRLPMAKAAPPAPKQPVKAIKAKKIAAQQAPARQASAASRKGGNSTSAKGKSGATGGNKGKSTGYGAALAAKYADTVRSRIARRQRYPKKAERRGQTGVAVISFVVSKSGDISALRLARSSGNKSLDNAALSAAKRAAPFPPIPDEAGMSRLVISGFPLRFGGR